MNQTEKVARWLADNGVGMAWTYADKEERAEYLAKAQEIIDLIDQQAEPVGGVNADGIVEWYDLDLPIGAKLYVLAEGSGG